MNGPKRFDKDVGVVGDLLSHKHKSHKCFLFVLFFPRRVFGQCEFSVPTLHQALCPKLLRKRVVTVYR